MIDTEYRFVTTVGQSMFFLSASFVLGTWVGYIYAGLVQMWRAKT